MQYTLMHKNIATVDMFIDEASGKITKLGSVYEPMHLPVGVEFKDGHANRILLNEWWCNRSIPASRDGIREALEIVGLRNTGMLLTRCMGLSLSDHYWIKGKDSSVSWHDINFFENTFSEDIGDALVGKAHDGGAFDFSSPDNTSDGCLRKRWKIIKGKRCLLKSGSEPYMQQPFNEVIAHRIMTRLGISNVPYYVMWDGEVPYSVCEDFITPDTELVPAWRIIQTQKKDNSTSVYRHYINCCESLGLKNITSELDNMLVADYIIANEDRHLNNFGLLRNPDTLEWLGAAPIFDSGSSLGYNKIARMITAEKNITCKPFKRNHEEQLLLVKSLGGYDFGSLEGIGNEIRQILSEAGEYYSSARAEAVAVSVEKRIVKLMELAETERISHDSTDGDVVENIAEDYGFGRMEL